MYVLLLSTERALLTYGGKNKEDCAVWTSHAAYAHISTEYWKALTTYGGRNKENCREGTSHAVYAPISTEYWKSFNNLRREEQRKLPRGNFTRGRWNVTYKTLYKEIDWLYKEIIL